MKLSLIHEQDVETLLKEIQEQKKTIAKLKGKIEKFWTLKRYDMYSTSDTDYEAASVEHEKADFGNWVYWSDIEKILGDE